MGETAVDVLYGAFNELILPDGRERLHRDCPDFNVSLVFFQPKKAAGATAAGTPAYEAGCDR